MILLAWMTQMGCWMHCSWVDKDGPLCLVSPSVKMGVKIDVASRSKDTLPFRCLTMVRVIRVRASFADAIATAI